MVYAAASNQDRLCAKDPIHLRSPPSKNGVSDYDPRCPPLEEEGGPAGSQQSETFSFFHCFHFQLKRSQYAPQITKALWLPNVKRGSGSEFKALHDPTPESDSEWEQEEAPKPGFFLQKKSKLCLLLLSQLHRILMPRLLLKAQWSPPGVRGRPGTVAFPVTTHPSCDLSSQASPSVASVFLLWLLLQARSRAALQAHPTHNFLRSNTNVPLGTPFLFS